MQTRSKKIQQFYKGKDEYLAQNLTQLLKHGLKGIFLQTNVHILNIYSYKLKND